MQHNVSRGSRPSAINRSRQVPASVLCELTLGKPCSTVTAIGQECPTSRVRCEKWEGSWLRSSFPAYAYGEVGRVRLNECKCSGRRYVWCEHATPRLAPNARSRAPRSMFLPSI